MKFTGEKFIFSCGFLTIALFVALFFSPNKALAEIDSSIIDYYDFNTTGGKDATLSAKNNGNTYGGYCSDRWGDGRNSDNGNSSVGYFSSGCRPVMNFASSTNSNIDFNNDGGFTVCTWQKEVMNFGWVDNKHLINSMGLVYNFNGNFTPPTGSNGCSSTTGNADIRSISNRENWNHYCVSVSATSSKIYYNKNEIFNCIHNNTPDNNVLNTFSPEPNYNAELYFYDDLIAFNRPLSSNEIETVYNSNDYSTIQITAPTSNDYVMYYGDNPSYTIRRKPFNFPVVYNVCDAYNDYEDFYRLRFNKDDNTYLTSPPIGTENNPCSGIYTFSEIAPDYEDSGTGYISIIGELGNEIASTSPFLYTVYTPVGQVGAFIKPNFKSPVYADYYSETSMELGFYYDVCIDDNFNTSNQICIDFVDTREMGQLDYNKTIHCKNLATCNGTINIDFPIAPMDMTAYFRASYYSGNLPDNPFVSSNPFLFTLYNSDAKDTENIFSATSIHEMACSAEDWASDDWWNKAKCSTFETGLNAMNNIAKSFKITILKFVGLIKNTFPFNFINLIQDTWEESETVELPEKLQFLNFSDSNGDIKIPVKIGAATSSIPIFGKSIFQNNESKDSYEKIRDLSTWMFRAMVLIYATMIGIKIYHELSGNKSE